MLVLQLPSALTAALLPLLMLDAGGRTVPLLLLLPKTVTVLLLLLRPKSPSLLLPATMEHTGPSCGCAAAGTVSEMPLLPLLPPLLLPWCPRVGEATEKPPTVEARIPGNRLLFRRSSADSSVTVTKYSVCQGALVGLVETLSGEFACSAAAAAGAAAASGTQLGTQMLTAPSMSLPPADLQQQQQQR
jgi:hypothetical protein